MSGDSINVGGWFADKKESSGCAERQEPLEVIMNVSVEADLLKTLPCAGNILSMAMMRTAAHLASCPGLVPRVQPNGGHTRMGQVCGNVTRNLKRPLSRPRT